CERAGQLRQRPLDPREPLAQGAILLRQLLQLRLNLRELLLQGRQARLVNVGGSGEAREADWAQAQQQHAGAPQGYVTKHERLRRGGADEIKTVRESCR